MRQEVIARVMTSVDGAVPGAGAPLPKHVKMAASPFSFMRGSAGLFYRDLAAGEWPSLPPSLYRDIPLTTIQGDCHLSNFGFITEEGSHGDSVIFSLNDFDDACIGHAVWDMLRFAASMHLAADYLQGVKSGRYRAAKAMDPAAQAAPDDALVIRANGAFLECYIATCDALGSAGQGHRQVIDEFAAGHVLQPLWIKAKHRAGGGKHFARKSALAKAAVWEADEIRFDSQNPNFAAPGDVGRQALETHFAPFMDDRVLDVAERLGAGTGSVNMGRYYFLVGPRDGRYPRDLPLCHIVEVKQQRRAAPLGFFDDLSPTNRLNPAHLTVVCQRRMQRQPDLVLDETRWRDAHWLIRSRHHAKVGIAPEMLLNPGAAGPGLIEYAETCGRALALAHSRGDRRSTRYERAVCATLAQHQEMLLDTAARCARQTVQDWALLNDMLAV
ncbi:DUF2252 domain-containing protein [Exilibacterium tricleocarpae]|uniref:DUF2252 domain-containing protein n=1 Tax=Exilibacterium tricleocarpae TaxID=2591008 RepID=A0A545U842_9GAMM|nr:DUF2252 family protein [Exilibacterium tricleocarpae]TQV85628.1 DUF2252 domain-containing protein [Exilibacterium tricleocarpae]